MACIGSASGRRSGDGAETTSENAISAQSFHKIAGSAAYRVYSASYRTGRLVLGVAGMVADAARGVWNVAFSESCHKIADFFRRLSEFKKSPAGRGELSVTRAIFHISGRMCDAFAPSAEAILSGNPAAGLKLTGEAIRNFFAKFWSRYRNAFNYIAPLTGIAVLALTVYMWSGATFAISVNYNGKTLGMVTSEQAFNNVLNSVETKVTEASGRNFTLDKTPVYRLSLAKKSDLSDEDELFDSLVQASGSEVEKGYGLYVNGSLVGAGTDGNSIQAMLDGILNTYKTDTRNQQVQFVQDVKIRNGIFPTSVMKTTTSMEDQLTASAKNLQSYTAHQGDSAIKVADMYHISLDKLYAMNESLATDGLAAGKTITVDDQTPSLTVRVVRNEVTTQSVPYSVQQINSDTLAKGKTKVVTPGQPGVLQLTNAVTYEGDKVVGTKLLSTTLLKAPVTEQVKVGSKSKSSKSGSSSGDNSAFNFNNDGGSGNVVGVAENYIGIRYRPGGSSPSSGFDCSGFTQYVYAQLGINLVHSAAGQSGQGSAVSKSSLQAGDLVFFDTNGGHNGINHVGIYIGGGNFVQANSTHPYAITISSLGESYWSRTYMTARRVSN